ncbi:Kinase-like protein [Mycena chlorophos]|uniref:Kinase-like protein n=1 Tax=Mycena chlorophos TaxID=658473 RepID=A0A8H6SWD5_MYCCL|nr:Kinase-like protein [Mycena chlorophos]
MSLPPFDPVQICTNPEDSHLCCSAHFPFKTAPGLCSRCIAVQAAATEEASAKILFERVKQCPVPTFLFKGVEKKRRIQQLVGDFSSETKKARTSNTSVVKNLPPLQSTFRPAIPEKTSTIAIAFGEITIDAESGTVSTSLVDVMDTELDTKVCELHDTLTGKGASQYVYKATIDGVSYAFKRFYNVGANGVVSLEANAKEVQKEAQRLGQTNWFWEVFKARAEQANISIESDICVTDFEIVCEVTKANTDPSTACGYSNSDIDTSDVPMVWLKEPFRSGRPEKWSGTNQHPTHHTSKLGNTLNAFAHFVYTQSHKTVVIADLQTTRARVGNKVAEILFDVTTHTKAGTSGVGDHGEEGIKQFLTQHECTARCEALGLVAFNKDE